MSYFVNKTDGQAIVVLDGTKDTTSTSLTLFGRLVRNYGDETNENFVRLLENFAYSASPANPIIGQIWFDTNTNNIKAYTTENTWVTVGSVLQSNSSISGNLAIGPYGFAVTDLDGNVQITNNASNGDVSFYSNVGGVSTRVLHINGVTGLVEVDANATANFGITTKIYVDSEIQRATSNGDTNLSANVAIINANLVARINAENDLRANIIAANAQIDLRATDIRVNEQYAAINFAILASTEMSNIGLAILTSDVNTLFSNAAVQQIQIDTINSNLSVRTAVDNQLQSSIDAANLAIGLRDTISRVNSLNAATNLAILANVGTNNANLDAVTSNVNTLFSNAAAQQIQINTINSNVSGVVTAFTSNAAAQQIEINSALAGVSATNVRVDGISANLGAYQIWANASVSDIYDQLSSLGAGSSADQIQLNALRANITAANASIVSLDNKLNSVNSSIDAALTSNIATKANILSPQLTGIPTAPTAALATNTTQIATTQYVMSRAVFWDGSRKFVSTSDPTGSDGSNGDIWFKYIP
jgi:hypothetical protein